MKIAFSSYSGYGAHFILRLLAEGHDVSYYLSEDRYSNILQGILPKINILKLDHRMGDGNYSAGLPTYSKFDLSVFDLTGRKRQADCSRMVCPTIGDGAIHCVLEDDRSAGIKLMEEAGISVPPYMEFTDISSAKAHVKKTGKRFVYKPNGGQDQNAETTYVSKSADDMLEFMDKAFALSKGAPFILQEFIKGTEISVEGWFNGTDFYCLNCTLEEKKFMNDGVGPNTGCSGNLVFTINLESRIYQEGLAKVKPMLAECGFRGMIDLNTIVTPDCAYGLEWTPRFGYDASTTFASMYGGGLGNLMYRTASGEIPENSWRAEFGASVRLTIPPYPTEIRMPKERGIPIKGIDLDSEEQVLKTYMYDVMIDSGHLVSAGVSGFLLAPVEIGNSIEESFGKLQDRVKAISIPDMQYRTDLQKCVSKRYNELLYQGWL